MKVRAIRPIYDIVVVGNLSDEIIEQNNNRIVIQRNNKVAVIESINITNFNDSLYTNLEFVDLIKPSDSKANGTTAGTDVLVDIDGYITKFPPLSDDSSWYNVVSHNFSGSRFRIFVEKGTWGDLATAQSDLEGTTFRYVLADLERFEEIINAEPVYGAGNNNFVYDKEAVATLLNTRLKTFKGEVKRNTDFGLPNFKNLDKDDLDIEIADIILTTAGVVSIKSFTSSLNNRDYNASIIVISDYGELEVTL